MIVTVTGPVTKRCPYRDETDEGTVTLTFNVGKGDAPELHGIAAALAEFEQEKASHEDFTRVVFALFAAHGISDVKTTWQTAGLDVTCTMDHWDASRVVPDRGE